MKKTNEVTRKIKDLYAEMPMSTVPGQSAEEQINLLFEVYRHLIQQLEKVAEGERKQKMRECCNWMLMFGGITFVNQRLNYPDLKIFSFENKGVDIKVLSQPSSPRSFSPSSYNNGGPTPIEGTVFRRTETIENKFDFGFTEGVKVGASAEVGFDIGLLNAKATVSAEVNFEAQQNWSKTKTVEESIEVPLTIPPFSTVSAYVEVEETKFSSEYTLKLLPTLTHDFREYFLWHDIYGDENLLDIFGEDVLFMSQKGTIDGVVGNNWRVVVNAPVPLQNQLVGV